MTKSFFPDFWSPHSLFPSHLQPLFSSPLWQTPPPTGVPWMYPSWGSGPDPSPSFHSHPRLKFTSAGCWILKQISPQSPRPSCLWTSPLDQEPQIGHSHPEPSFHHNTHPRLPPPCVLWHFSEPGPGSRPEPFLNSPPAFSPPPPLLSHLGTKSLSGLSTFLQPCHCYSDPAQCHLSMYYLHANSWFIPWPCSL